MINSSFGNQTTNQQIGKASESGIKFFIKWVSIAIVTLAKTIKMLILTALGK